MNVHRRRRGRVTWISQYVDVSKSKATILIKFPVIMAIKQSFRRAYLINLKDLFMPKSN